MAGLSGSAGRLGKVRGKSSYPNLSPVLAAHIRESARGLWVAFALLPSHARQKQDRCSLNAMTLSEIELEQNLIEILRSLKYAHHPDSPAKIEQGNAR